MSEKINICDAMGRFCELVERAEAGEEIIIARAGLPVARLISLRGEEAKRKPGRMRGRIRIADDFDEPLPGHLFGRERLGFLAGEIAVPDDFDRMAEGEIEAMFGYCLRKTHGVKRDQRNP